MLDPSVEAGPAAEAISSIHDAQRAVESASAEVDEVGRHFRKAVNADRQPDSIFTVLENATRASPLTMLGLAFAAGVIFVRRR